MVINAFSGGCLHSVGRSFGRWLVWVGSFVGSVEPHPFPGWVFLLRLRFIGGNRTEHNTTQHRPRVSERRVKLFRMWVGPSGMHDLWITPTMMMMTTVTDQIPFRHSISTLTEYKGGRKSEWEINGCGCGRERERDRMTFVLLTTIHSGNLLNKLVALRCCSSMLDRRG